MTMDTIAAPLAAEPVGGVGEAHPDQTVRVPVSPTDAMLDAAHEVPIKTFNDVDVTFTTNREATAIYRAMLAAAPSPEAEGADAEELEASIAFLEKAFTTDGHGYSTSYRPTTVAVKTVLASLQRPQPPLLPGCETPATAGVVEALCAVLERIRDDANGGWGSAVRINISQLAADALAAARKSQAVVG